MQIIVGEVLIFPRSLEGNMLRQDSEFFFSQSFKHFCFYLSCFTNVLTHLSLWVKF